ncbi:hypothetical protein FACHB389_35270 [Nostoc calcicola FACHB-389]|nr:hypothetical protein FACHB389_35270 [Nostoc calcicola FACHB-389]
MENPAKGGRGKRAPYQTVMCRMPEPIKHLAEELSANYRELLSDFENPEDPALVAAVLEAVARCAGGSDDQRTEQLLKDYQQMQEQIERLNQQIEKLQSTQNQDIISKAILEFIENQKTKFGKTSSQKNKEFSLNTRSWDAFREFIKFVQPKQQIQSLNGWNVGDKCSVRMPSGVTITEAEIAAIFPSGDCKISVPSTDSHFTSELSSLTRE